MGIRVTLSSPASAHKKMRLRSSRSPYRACRVERFVGPAEQRTQNPPADPSGEGLKIPPTATGEAQRTFNPDAPSGRRSNRNRTYNLLIKSHLPLPERPTPRYLFRRGTSGRD